MDKPRFYVAETSGYLTMAVGKGDEAKSLSCHILDRSSGDAVVATYRTEDMGGRLRRATRRLSVRTRAARRCAELNEWDERDAAAAP